MNFPLGKLTPSFGDVFFWFCIAIFVINVFKRKEIRCTAVFKGCTSIYCMDMDTELAHADYITGHFGFCPNHLTSPNGITEVPNGGNLVRYLILVSEELVEPVQFVLRDPSPSCDSENVIRRCFDDEISPIMCHKGSVNHFGKIWLQKLHSSGEFWFQK